MKGNGEELGFYEASLLAMIDAVLTRTWSVTEFESSYYDFYLDEVPDQALTEYEHEFFGRVQEQLDLVAEHPDPVSRRDGWMDHPEFLEWLETKRKQYLIGHPEK